MSWTISVRNYRGLRRVKWSPQFGLSCLVGPNGVGKTTLLSVPNLMARAAEVRGPGAALDGYGGTEHLRHVEAGDEPIVLRVSDGSTSRWSLEPSAVGDIWGEELLAGKSHYRRRLGQKGVSLNGEVFAADERSLLYNLHAKSLGLEGGHDGESILKRLESYRVHHDYALGSLRENGSKASIDVRLDRSGLNVLTVLRNWRDKPSTLPKYEFVVDGLRDCFPFFEDIVFEGSQNITGRFVQGRGPTDGFPLLGAPNGLLVGLLHLAAVASADDGGIVAIDEVENSLHPAALHGLLDLMDEYAQEKGLTVIVSTQAPMVLDWFEPAPDRVWVMEPSQEVSPMPLSRLKDPGWLSHFRLGQLYASREFGAPVGKGRTGGGGALMTGRPALDRVLERFLASPAGPQKVRAVVFEDLDGTVRMTTTTRQSRHAGAALVVRPEGRDDLPISWDALIHVVEVDADRIGDVLVGWWQRGARPHSTLASGRATALGHLDPE